MKKILENRFFPFFPLIVIIILVFVYWASDYVFVQCENGLLPCSNIDGKLISQVNNNTISLANSNVANTNFNEISSNINVASVVNSNSNAVNSNANVANSNSNGTNSNVNGVLYVRDVLNEKKGRLNTRTNRVAAKKGSMEDTQKSIDEKVQELKLNKDETAKIITDNISIENTNTSNSNTSNGNGNTPKEKIAKLANTKQKLDEQKGILEDKFKTEQKELETLEKDKNEVENDIIGVLSQISSRYSSRMTWIFLTAVFFMLCVAAIFVSGFVIWHSSSDWRKVWLGLTFSVATIFAIWTFNNELSYMSIVLPIFEQSVAKNGDLSINTVNFINVVGFFATIFLVSASCAILYAVRKTTQSAETLESNKEILNEKLKLVGKEIGKKDLTTQFDKADLDIKTFTTALEKANADNESLTAQLEQKDSAIKALEEKLAIVDADIETLTPQLVKANADKVSFTTQLTQSESDIVALTSQLDTANADKATFESKLTNTDKEILQLTDKVTKLENETSKVYDTYREYIKIVLYVGALMLFVGMLRVKLLADWHLIFISLDPANAYYKILADFFTSSITVQAGFYTILLAVIYLPVAYAISVKTSSDVTTNEVKENGWWSVSFAELLPRIFAIISPVLAGPIVTLFNYLINKAS